MKKQIQESKNVKPIKPIQNRGKSMQLPIVTAVAFNQTEQAYASSSFTCFKVSQLS